MQEIRRLQAFAPGFLQLDQSQCAFTASDQNAADVSRQHGAGFTRPGGKLPLNTNGGGLSYMHSGMYGMYALQESVRQMRGIAPAQVKDAKISVCHGVGGMFAASGTIIFTNEK